MNRVAPAVFALIVVPVAFPAAGFAQDNCVECHLKLEEELLSAPARAVADDVHAKAGITCADCHGGDPKAAIVGDDYRPAMDPRKGFIGTPEVGKIPALCGRCHGDAAFMRRYNPNASVDQLAQYWTSVHGQRLREGAADVAECSSCHTSHSVLLARDPRSPVYPTRVAETCARCHADVERMKPYGIPTDQFDKYRSSVHGRALYDEGDLGAPTCNSCHGNHGAAPPGVDSVSLVCGSCHSIQKDLFAGSPHKAAFDAMDQPECETCHGNHDIPRPTDDLVGVGEGAICTDCHSEGETAFEVARTLHDEITGLKESISAASEIVERASRAGMEVSEAELGLLDANQAVVQSRNLVHAFAAEPLRGKVEEGRSIAEMARQMGLAALAELQFRRKGLAVSLVFILMVVAGLYLKIRQIEGRS